MSDLDDVVNLARHLIDVESTSGNEYPMVNVLKSWLEARGWRVESQLVLDNRYNVFAYPLELERICDIELLFNSHIDTVPPYFKSRIEENGSKLCGRGACDTKSLIASQLLAANKLKNNGICNIGLLYVVGEEVDHCGMKMANKLIGLKPKYLIVGEPTELSTINIQKGILKFELISNGIAAHSGYPETGLSAINVLLEILYDINNITKWPSNDKIGRTTVNIGILKSGLAANIIPNKSYSQVMFRCITSPLEIEKEIKKIIKKYDKKNQIIYKKISQSFPQKYCIINNKYNPLNACFNTDIPYFKHYQNGHVVPVLFGPGSIKDAHTKREHVMIDDLKKSVQIYQDIAKELLSGKHDTYLDQKKKSKL